MSTPWMLSQAPQDSRPEDAELRPVPISAKITALGFITEVLEPRSRIDGELVVIADAAVHAMAIRIDDMINQALAAGVELGRRKGA